MNAPKLTILPFLQAWDPATRQLTLNVLVTPVGDPRQPLDSLPTGQVTARAFAGCEIVLAPHVSTNAGQIPTLADTPAGGATLPLTMPATQGPLFDALANAFRITQPQQPFQRDAAFTLRKYLPRSYRAAFDFIAPKTDLAVIDDSYFCALRCARDALPGTAVPTDEVSWGEVFAMLLRQPFMARAAGLIHTVQVTLPDPFPGGWVFFSLAGTSDYASNASTDPDFLKLYSTRVPELDRAARPVFTAVSFPVAADAAALAALGPFDEVFDEAESYDDGFAKIVHARQPDTGYISADDGEGPELVADPGIQLGWDDEDVLVATNRGVGLNADGSTPPEAPSSVAGYRVDVRPAGDTTWHTMCQIGADASSFGGVALGGFEQETNVEVHPTKLDKQFWLPPFFTAWLGRSLVALTPDEMLLSNRGVDEPSGFVPMGGDAVPLRYGRSYDFRVRLADMTGGGPDWTIAPVRRAQQPVARHDMRRKVRMRRVKVTPDLLGSAPPAHATPVSFQVRRPGCGYPEAVFTGLDGAFEALRDAARHNETLPDPENRGRAKPGTDPSLRAVEVPDPDALALEIKVYAATPTFDPAGGRDGQVLVSRTYRAFPTLPDATSETALQLELDWVTAGRLSERAWPMESQPVGATGPVAVPRGRDVRIVVRAVGRQDLSYFATPEAALGDEVALWNGTLNVPAVDEPPVFEPLAAVDAVASVFLQPDPVENAATRSAPTQQRPSPLLAKRLASALDLVEEDGVLYGQPGQRVVFACNGLKHHLAPDGSSVALLNRSELAQTWITAVRIPLARDWTWTGYAKPALKLSRRTELSGRNQVSTVKLGDVAIEHTIGQQAARVVPPDRERIEVIVIDAFEPPLGHDGFPYEPIVSYQIEARFDAAPSQQQTLNTHLPVATPPQVAPKVVSAGHALSPYTATEDYAETLDRERLLWLEFAEDPRQDPRDVLYGRVVARAADPMLLPDWEPEADPPNLAEIDLDPETVRVIRPGQPDDNAGLSAMQPLIPARDSSLHYALPLPANVAPESADLFGFFTYEFRVGHPRGTQEEPYWSTAQGRFGPPTVIEGVQFPAPKLDCTVRRFGQTWQLSAKHARPVIDGEPVAIDRPNTVIWFVLYARVMQADGTTRRNVQLSRTIGRPEEPRPGRRPIRSFADWTRQEVEAALARLGLPASTPCSTLAVELLPEPNGTFWDPLGFDLGEVRILRTSRLVEIPDDCCVE